MAQAYITTGSQFTPYTFDELLKPFLLYKEELDKQTKDFEDYDTNAEAIGAFLDSNLDSDIYSTYTNYMDALNSAATDLSKQGLTPESKEKLSALKRSFNKDMLPIKAGIEARDKARQQWNELSAKDRTLMTSFNPNTASVSAFMNGKTPESINVSGNDLMQRAYNIAQVVSKNNIQDPEFMKVMGGQYYQIKQEYGLDSPEMDAFIRDNVVGVPEIDAMIQEVLSSSNVDKLSAEDQDRAIKYALEGAFNGMQRNISYNYQTNRQWDFDKQLALKEASDGSEDPDKNPDFMSNTLSYNTKTSRDNRKEREYLNTLQQTANGTLIDPSERITEEQYQKILAAQQLIDAFEQQVSPIDDFHKLSKADQLKYQKEYNAALNSRGYIKKTIPKQQKVKELTNKYNYLNLGTDYENVNVALDYQESQLAEPFTVVTTDSSKITEAKNQASNVLKPTSVDNLKEVNDKDQVSKIGKGKVEDILSKGNFVILTSNKHSIILKDLNTGKMYIPENDYTTKLDGIREELNNELKDFSAESLNSYDNRGYKRLNNGYTVKVDRVNNGGETDIIKTLYTQEGIYVGSSSLRDEAYNNGKARGNLITSIMQSILEDRSSK